MSRLDGKVAIVTGAASGIGRAMVIEMARAGAAVLAADVNEAGLRETVELASGIGDVTSQEGDVARADDVEALVRAAVTRYGKLTTICNNAGVSFPNSVIEATEEEFDRTMAVNVRGVFFGCKYAIPAMLETAGGGSIINTGSVNSLMAERVLCTYCASKGAVLMLTRQVALDFAAQGIRCNCICPGFVDTPINIPHYERLGGIEQIRESLPEWQPIGRAGETEEIAKVAVFLASDDSSFVTGIALLADGGLTAGV